MQEYFFEFELHKHKFEFKAEKRPDAWYDDERLSLSYKIDGYGASDSGWTYGARYEPKDKSIFSHGFAIGERTKNLDHYWKLNGKEIRSIKLVNKQEITDTLDKMYNEIIEERAESDKQSLVFVPKKFQFARGGDTWHVYVVQNERKVTEQPEELAKIEKFLNRGMDNFKQIAEISKKLPDLHTGLYTDMWYEIDLDTVQQTEEYKLFLEELDAIKQKNEQAKLKRLEIFATAKKTGKPQNLPDSGWSEGCNDPEESCDIDNCYLVAMPDGSTKVVRNHTW